MIRRTFVALAGAACGLAFVGASAHQQKESVTEVLFNSRTENIEVAHRFVLHDAEHVAQTKLGLNRDLIGSPETRAAFADYVAQRFGLAGPDGTPLPLTLLGSEIKDGYLWVYQETPLVDVAALQLRHDALRDVWPEQINRVNLKKGGIVKSVVFTDAVVERWAEFK